MIAEFPHKAPKGYSYEFEVFNTRTIAIWLCYEREFDYNMGKPTRTIWGFYAPKKNCYYAPECSILGETNALLRMNLNGSHLVLFSGTKPI